MTGAYVGAPPLGKRHRANRAEHDGVSMAAVWAALIAKKKPRLWVEPGLSTGPREGLTRAALRYYTVVLGYPTVV
jgi:hypothetical protein